MGVCYSYAPREPAPVINMKNLQVIPPLQALLCLCLIGICVTGHGAAPDAPYPATLLRAYQDALDHDTQLAAAVAGYKAEAEAVPQSWAAGVLPQVNLNGFWEQTDQKIISERNVVSLGPGMDFITNPGYDNVENYNWQFVLTQPLLRVPQWFQLRSAYATRRSAQAQLGASEQQLILRVVQAYMGVLRAAQQVRSGEAELAALQRQLEQVRQRFEVGLAAITDTLESQAAHDSAKAQLLQSQSELRIAFTNLANISGVNYPALAPVDADFPIGNPQPDDEQAWVDLALEHSLALRQANATLHAARSNLAASRAQHLPSVDLQAIYTRNVRGSTGGFSTQDTETGDTVLRASASMPLFQGGLVLSQSRQNRWRVKQAEHQLENIRRTLIRDVHNLFNATTTAVATVAARRQSMISAQSALDATETGYSVGTRNIVDVLQAQRNLFLAQFQYASSRIDYIIRLTELHQTAGTLSPVHLQMLNNSLTHSPHAAEKEAMQDTPAAEANPAAMDADAPAMSDNTPATDADAPAMSDSMPATDADASAMSDNTPAAQADMPATHADSPASPDSAPNDAPTAGGQPE